MDQYIFAQNIPTDSNEIKRLSTKMEYDNIEK